MCAGPMVLDSRKNWLVHVPQIGLAVGTEGSTQLSWGHRDQDWQLLLVTPSCVVHLRP